MYECFWQLFSGFLTLPLHQTHTHTHTHTHTRAHTHSPRLLWQDQTLLYGTLSGSLGFRHTAELFLVTRREEERHRKRETDRKRQTERDGRSGGLSLSETLTAPLSTSLTRAIISSTEEKPRWRAVIVTDEISVSLWLDVEPVANVWCVWPWWWLF